MLQTILIRNQGFYFRTYGVFFYTGMLSLVLSIYSNYLSSRKIITTTSHFINYIGLRYWTDFQHERDYFLEAEVEEEAEDAFGAEEESSGCA